NSSVKCIRVESSNEMYEHCVDFFKTSDIAIMSAAVADYKAADYSSQKIKKKEDTFQINLTKTTDILAELGKQKKNQCLVGFALETENVIEYATKKIKAKNLDFIIANSLQDAGAGFATDTNKISIVDNTGK